MAANHRTPRRPRNVALLLVVVAAATANKGEVSTSRVRLAANDSGEGRVRDYHVVTAADDGREIARSVIVVACNDGGVAVARTHTKWEECTEVNDDSGTRRWRRRQWKSSQAQPFQDFVCE